MTVAAAPDVLFRKFEGEAVLLHLGSERYFSLNDSALRIWELLTEGADVETAATTVAAEYDVASDVVRRDVDELVRDLRTLGLITVGEE